MMNSVVTQDVQRHKWTFASFKYAQVVILHCIATLHVVPNPLYHINPSVLSFNLISSKKTMIFE